MIKILIALSGEAQSSARFAIDAWRRTGFCPMSEGFGAVDNGGAGAGQAGLRRISVAINPNAKAPRLLLMAITVLDSHAILLYLAEKTGRFLTGRYRASAEALVEMLSWLSLCCTWPRALFGRRRGGISNRTRPRAEGGAYADFSVTAMRRQQACTVGVVLE